MISRPSAYKMLERAYISATMIPRMFDVGKRDLFFGLLVAVIAFLTYANSLGNGFVWDDTNVVLNNPVLRGSPLSLFHSLDDAGFKWIPYYRPLTLLTFLFEDRLHSLTPALMHLLNIMLHSANAFLVYHLARSFVKDYRPPLLAGLLFAVHPLNAESVNFISGGRNTLLACFFVLSSYLCHLKGVTDRKNSFILSGAIFYIAGLFSKESAIMALPFLVAFEIPSLRSGITSSVPHSFVRLMPYAVGTMIYLTMRWMTLADHGIQFSVLPGLGARLTENLYIIPRYLLSLTLPTFLSARYVIPEYRQFPVVPLTAAWICISCIIGWLLTKGRSKTTFFGLIWFVAFWLPVSGIISFPSVPLADRYLYIPAIGIWIVIADQALRLLLLRVKVCNYSYIAGVIMILVLMTMTARRNMDWKSNISLFARLVEQYPKSAYGHAALGEAYLKSQVADDLELAEQELTRAMTLEPSMKELYALLGHIRLNRGDFAGALQYYSEVLKKDPSDMETLLNRGIAFEGLGRIKEALADYQLFLSMPDDNNLQGSRQFAEEKVRELSGRIGM